MKVDTFSMIVVVALLVLLVYFGCSTKRADQKHHLNLPTQVLDNPLYDTVDIEAGKSYGDRVSVEGEMEFLLANHDRVIDSLLQPGVRPPNDARVYYAIAINRRNHLTLRLEEGQAVLVFTSENRAKHYLTQVEDLEIEGEVGADVFSANDWEFFVQNWLSSGISHIIIDKCPYCQEVAVFGLASDKKNDDWVRLCAVVGATRILQYDLYLGEAKQAIGRGDARKARTIGEHIVTYIDAERPEVHLLLAHCGLVLKDQEMVKRKRKVLSYFGEEWTRRLEQIAQ